MNQRKRENGLRNVFINVLFGKSSDGLFFVYDRGTQREKGGRRESRANGEVEGRKWERRRRKRGESKEEVENEKRGGRKGGGRWETRGREKGERASLYLLVYSALQILTWSSLIDKVSFFKI